MHEFPLQSFVIKMSLNSRVDLHDTTSPKLFYFSFLFRTMIKFNSNKDSSIVSIYAIYGLTSSSFRSNSTAARVNNFTLPQSITVAFDNTAVNVHHTLLPESQSAPAHVLCACFIL